MFRQGEKINGFLIKFVQISIACTGHAENPGWLNVASQKDFRRLKIYQQVIAIDNYNNYTVCQCKYHYLPSPVSIQCQLNVKQYQLASSCLSPQGVKSLRSKWLFKRNCFQLPLIQNLRSWIRAYYKLSKAEQLLACFSSTCSWQCINLQQTSSSYSHCRLKSLKGKADLCLDKVRFLCIAHSGTGTNLLFAVNTSGMGKKGKNAQVSPWCFYFQHLAMMATQRTGQLWPKCFH